MAGEIERLRAMPIGELFLHAGAAGITGVVGVVMFEVWSKDDPLMDLAIYWFIGVVSIVLLIAGFVIGKLSASED